MIFLCFCLCVAVAQLDSRRLAFEVSRSHTTRHTHTHTHPIGLLWMTYQPVAEAATHTTQTNTRNELPCHLRDSNAAFQQSRSFRTTPQTVATVTGDFLVYLIINYTKFATNYKSPLSFANIVSSLRNKRVRLLRTVYIEYTFNASLLNICIK